MESTLARLGVAAKLTVKQQFRKKSCSFFSTFSLLILKTGYKVVDSLQHFKHYAHFI